MKTIDSLGIFWTFDSDKEKYQDEVDGLVFYGYWEKPFPQEILDHVDDFLELWRHGQIEIKPRVWDGRENCNLSIEVRIIEWPINHWNNSVEESLRWFVKHGAVIAWCGAECSSPSLDVFSSEESSGGIYAAYTPKTGFMCKSGLYEEYDELGEEEHAKLRRALE